MGSGQNFMVPQLSISGRVSQLHNARFFGFGKQLVQSLVMLALTLGSASLCHAQGADFEMQVEPLTAIDRQFMTEQRGRVEALANRLGRGLTGNVDRDLDTLQRILDQRMVPTSDTLTLQAMGLVFGDLLGDRLSMQWVVYRDRQGRSRALRYRDLDVFLFPMTMISRRQEAGSDRRLRPLFDETVAETRPLLPGGKWFQ